MRDVDIIRLGNDKITSLTPPEALDAFSRHFPISMDPQQKSQLYQNYVKSGQREQAIDWLRSALTDSGWKDQVRAKIKAIVDRDGLGKITVEQIYAEVLPEAQDLVPASVRDGLRQRIERSTKSLPSKTSS
ncbi:transcription factor e(y)2-domain-containing protein [Catenaria anguillulae PL171]|uniref:Transcription and mRNA export factor SUS1 n=1 Tax=Catenaria anguillulae PL171 TaxID=765915 RepID=A0A1Y2HND6_9FUNG|nr:transcription factor e(y)2-domain-containing protein [Catenaria anguillulae PL171]